MLHRIRALFIAELAALRGGASLLLTAGTHGLIAGLLGGIVRGEIPPFAFAIYAYSVAAGLVTLPLLGELGTWLRTPPAPEWCASLPCTAADRALARLAVLLVAIAGLSLGTLLPLTLLAPGLDWAGRAVFLFAGLGAAIGAAAVLLLAQGLLERAAPAALVALQTTATVAVAGALLLGLPTALRLGEYVSLDALPESLVWAPPVWFAAAFGADGLDVARLPWPALASAAAVVLAGLGVVTRREGAVVVRSGTNPLDRVLEPLRRIAAAVWVRPSERGSFDFVFAAMPAEREVALRTAPLLAVPLIFAWVALGKQPGDDKDAFVALILFTPGFYLPVLLAHVPASASHSARWLMETAPVDRSTLLAGAFKAVVVRYVVPLHIALAALAWQQAGADLALRLALPATLVTVLVTRILFRATVDQPPLSTPPEEAGDPQALTGPLMAAGVSLAIIGMAAEYFLTTPLIGLAASAMLVGVLVATDRVAQPTA